MGDRTIFFIFCFPVVNVSWHDTILFCNALSKNIGLSPCYTTDDDMEQVIPEGRQAELEAGIQDTAVPFDDDFDGGIGEALKKPEAGKGKQDLDIPSDLKTELRSILSYMDRLLESLPEEKIEEFAKSQYFDSYKKLFKDLGLV
jgi:hypothetical protein